MEEEEMVGLDREMISQITGSSGLNVVQAALLGMEVPLRKGCVHQLLNREIPKTLLLRVLYYTDAKRPARTLKKLRKQGKL